MSQTYVNDGYGFNKLKRMMAIAAERNLRAENVPLDPDFPFVVVNPPTTFFISRIPLGGNAWNSGLLAEEEGLYEGW